MLTAALALAAAASACGPYPALPVKAPAGYCVAVVADAKAGLRFPRAVLAVGPGEVLVTDPGGWEPKRGRLWLVKAGETPRELAKGLDRPHGLARGPDGRIYLAETTRVQRFAWPAARVSFEPVVDGLPAGGRHLLKQIAFDREGGLLINVGSATDRCESADGKPPVPPACPEAQGPQPQGAVYRLAPGARQAQPWARGLRNSIALAVHASGTVLQAENGIDLSDADSPPEEINVLKPGQDYGWPFCAGLRSPMLGADAAHCARTAPAHMTLPAHAAPLDMRYSRRWAPPGQAEALLMSWHGYRPSGHRLVRFAVDAQGLPRGKPEVLIDLQWRDGQGRQQLGAPVGLAEDEDGSLWIADDRNRLLLRLMRAP